MQYGEAVEATEHFGAIHDWLIDITQTNEASKSIITDVQVPWCLDRSHVGTAPETTMHLVMAH